VKPSPHRVNEVETGKKFKTGFSENCFSLIRYCFFADPTNKSTSCCHRSLYSKSTEMVPAYDTSKALHFSLEVRSPRPHPVYQGSLSLAPASPLLVRKVTPPDIRG